MKFFVSFNFIMNFINEIIISLYIITFVIIFIFEFINDIYDQSHLFTNVLNFPFPLCIFKILLFMKSERKAGTIMVC